MSKIAELSVLIPNYNYVCLPLVRRLQSLLESAAIPYEIIVADDGSTDLQTIEANRPIATLTNCQYLIRPKNVGRAVIRNILAQTAQYAFLLYIDSDLTIINDQFIRRYVDCLNESTTVIDGGVSIGGNPEALKGNLRYLYEKAEEPNHTAICRQASPYQHLHTANLLIRKELILQHPFDERFRHYGYEDVLLGKTLRQHQIPITHIDNPLGFHTFESNNDFIVKTEEGLRTLYQFRRDLRGYSRLLTFVSGIHISLILSLIRLWHRLFQKAERRNLCGSRPSLLVYKLYRLGYFLSLE
jgi:glycosyltransferase involved in cell wall biosynthesis